MISPDWIVGYTEGDGCFIKSYSRYRRDKSRVYGVRTFNVTSVEEDSCNIFKDFFGFGRVTLKYKNGRKYPNSQYVSKPIYAYEVSKESDIQKLILFFEGRLQTKKYIKRFEDFKNFKTGRLNIEMENEK